MAIIQNLSLKQLTKKFQKKLIIIKINLPFVPYIYHILWMNIKKYNLDNY